MCDGGMGAGSIGCVSKWGNRQQKSRTWRGCLTPADLSELDVERSTCCSGCFSPFLCMVIHCQTAEDQRSSLQAGTDGPALPEHTGSTDAVSAVGARRSQMGGRTGDIEL